MRPVLSTCSSPRCRRARRGRLLGGLHQFLELPTPEPVAAALAAGLTSGDPERVVFDGHARRKATDSVRNAVGALSSITRTVTVESVT